LAFWGYFWLFAFGLILAVLVTSVIAWVLGIAPHPTEIFSTPASISPIFLELDIKGAFSLALLPVIITFFVTDLFDSIGTLAGVGTRAGIFDENKKDGVVKLEKTLEADAVATACRCKYDHIVCRERKRRRRGWQDWSNSCILRTFIYTYAIYVATF